MLQLSFLVSVINLLSIAIPNLSPQNTQLIAKRVTLEHYHRDNLEKGKKNFSVDEDGLNTSIKQKPSNATKLFSQ